MPGSDDPAVVEAFAARERLLAARGHAMGDLLARFSDTKLPIPERIRALHGLQAQAQAAVNDLQKVPVPAAPSTT